jgi:hypothetical protein
MDHKELRGGKLGEPNGFPTGIDNDTDLRETDRDLSSWMQN